MRWQTMRVLCCHLQSVPRHCARGLFLIRIFQHAPQLKQTLGNTESNMVCCKDVKQSLKMCSSLHGTWFSIKTINLPYSSCILYLALTNSLNRYRFIKKTQGCRRIHCFPQHLQWQDLQMKFIKYLRIIASSMSSPTCWHNFIPFRSANWSLNRC